MGQWVTLQFDQINTSALPIQPPPTSPSNPSSLVFLSFLSSTPLQSTDYLMSHRYSVSLLYYNSYHVESMLKVQDGEHKATVCDSVQCMSKLEMKNLKYFSQETVVNQRQKQNWCRPLHCQSPADQKQMCLIMYFPFSLITSLFVP